jgi:hypothetical protein
MPLVGNILNFFDLGGQSIAGYQAFLGPNQVTVIGRVWQSLTVLGVIGAALLATCVLCIVSQVYRADRDEIGEMPGRTDKPGNSQSIFVIALLVMYCLPISALEQQYWFDRYLILCLPLAMMVAVISTSKSVNTGAGVATIGSEFGKGLAIRHHVASSPGHRGGTAIARCKTYSFCSRQGHQRLNEYWFCMRYPDSGK